MKLMHILILSMVIGACSGAPSQQENPYPTTGAIERFHPALDNILDTTARIEVIAEGFEWSEGPLWVESQQMLVFSDVPANIIYKWTEQEGTSVYLEPSGYNGTAPFTGREPGSNGLTLDHDGRLVICQHGNRQVARMEAPWGNPQPEFVALADNYQGKRLNSPNDVVFDSTGDLFFTDPPYGLPTQRDDDPIKEIGFNGIFKATSDGEVTLLSDALSRPNGLAFFPGERQLLVANSDPDAADWYLVDMDNPSAAPQLFYSATDAREGVNGLPDGLKINRSGVVFASGPGGIWIFDQEATVLGRIQLADAASNLAFSADEQTIYITNHRKILRVKLR